MAVTLINTSTKKAVPAKAGTVRLTEIFYSLQGEGRFTGLPTVFVRLTGCPLRCVYCDTAYAFEGGTPSAIADVIKQIKSYGAQYVCVTGGEPLAQKEACHTLMTSLCDEGLGVSLETSGAMDISLVDPRVCVVMDLKTPASGEMHRNLLSNIPVLAAKDQLKFVICNREDYDWAKSQLLSFNLLGKGIELLFSPSFGQLSYKQLAEWILKDKLNVRMQVQLHKQIWGDEPSR